MNTVGRLSDERGLVGKLAVMWLVVVALLVVAAFDTGSIALTRFKVASAAEKAAFEAAATYKETANRDKAFEAALAELEREAPGSRLAKDGFSINQRTGEVTVKAVDRASTLLASRIGFLKGFTKTTATETAGPPTL